MLSANWMLIIFLGLIGLLASGMLRSKFSRYSKVLLRRGLSGREVAEKMLADNGIYDVKVVSVDGYLSDHYNPATRTVNLSPDVYEGRSIAAAAVAAHECGHAVQHKTAYQWLTLRSRLVPVVQFSSTLVPWILMGGVILVNRFPGLLLVGILLFALTTLFSLVTLPVEIDASRRALAWLNKSSVTTSDEYPQAKDALKWAAFTYVVAAVSSIITLIYYISVYNNRRQ